MVYMWNDGLSRFSLGYQLSRRQPWLYRRLTLALLHLLIVGLSLFRVNPRDV